jgi:hypothetical protein
MGCTERIVENGKIVERDCHTKGKPQAEPAPLGYGPGTELKAMLRSWGIEANLGCSCNAMARKMNSMGAGWCEGAGLSEILAAMRGEHAKRWAKGKTLLPWSDLGAKLLVRLACRRARARTFA